MCSAGSPMISAASAIRSMASSSGACGNGLRHHAVAALENDARQFDARCANWSPAARVRICAAGQREISRMLRTAPWHAMPAPGNDLQVLPRQLKGGHDADVGGARCQVVGAIRGKAEIQIEKTPLRAVEHAPDQRRGIQVADGRYPGPLRDSVAQPTVYQTVDRAPWYREVLFHRLRLISFYGAFSASHCLGLSMPSRNTLLRSFCSYLRHRRTGPDHFEHGAHARGRPTAIAGTGGQSFCNP